jgi:hypothetical protein
MKASPQVVWQRPTDLMDGSLRKKAQESLLEYQAIVLLKIKQEINMSFRCEICGKLQPARSAPHKVVTETRRKNYPERRKGTKVIDYGGSGYETVSEVNACEKCAKPKDIAQAT